MTVNEDDEIDLRPYLRALIYRWRWIVIAGVILAVIAVVISLILPPEYESSATFLLTRKSSTLSLSYQFPTVTEGTDVNTRATTILTIAQGDSIATTVMQKLQIEFPSEDFKVERLKKDVTFTTKGEVLVIAASAPTPELAAGIANIWAQEVINAANIAYRGEQSLESIRTQRESSQQKYQGAQTTLEEFLRNSQINALDQQIKEYQNLLDNIGDERIWLINYYTFRQRDMTDLITKAEALKTQLEKGSVSSSGKISDALALLITRLNAFSLLSYNNNNSSNNSSQDTSLATTTNSMPRYYNVQNGSGSSPITLQITDPEILMELNGNSQTDLEAIIQVAQMEKSAAEAKLATLTQETLSETKVQALEEVAQALNALQTQLEAENARQRELTSERDLAWNAYQALLSKETEVQSIPQVSNEVVLVGTAIPPIKPVSRGTLRNGLIGVVVGAMAVVFWIIGREWWHSAGINLPKPGVS